MFDFAWDVCCNFLRDLVNCMLGSHSLNILGKHVRTAIHGGQPTLLVKFLVVTRSLKTTKHILFIALLSLVLTFHNYSF